MAFEGRLDLAVGGVPESDGPIGAARGDRLAVGRDRDGEDRPVMPLEAQAVKAAGDLPEPDLAIDAPRGERPAVGRKGDRRDLLTRTADAQDRPDPGPD